MLYIALWVLSGVLCVSAVVFIGWWEGSDITRRDILFALLFAMLGPLMFFVLCYHLVRLLKKSEFKLG